MRSLDKTFFTFPKSKPEKRCNTGTFPNHPKPAMPFFSRTISTVKSPSGGILRYAAIVAQDGTPKLWSTPRPEQRTEVPQNSSLNEGGWDPTATENIRFHDVSGLFALKLRKVFLLAKNESCETLPNIDDNGGKSVRYTIRMGVGLKNIQHVQRSTEKCASNFIH